MFGKKFCAHRGVSALLPENTLPAFAAALVLGADEMEFDVRLTGDGKLIVSHDLDLERVSDGCGNIADYTLEELKQLNAGLERGWTVGFCTPEEIFDHFANRITFNIHLKEHGEDGFIIRELLKLIEKHDAYGSVYFAGVASELEWMERIAPGIPRVAIQTPKNAGEIFDIAAQYHCSGVQFWLGLFDKALIDRFHNAGMWCNLFYADHEDDYRKYFDMGIDTLLTNRADLAADYKHRFLL